MYRWMQFSVQDVESKIKTKEWPENMRTRGHHYTCPNSMIEMIEYHVDEHESLLTLANGIEHGGYLSVRFPIDLKLICLWVYDESAYMQHLYSTHQWVTDEGERPLMPKSNGYTLMISAFQSCEFGFGMQLSEEQLVKVNQHRDGKCYIYEDAAEDINNGSKMKPALKTLPFLAYFETGANSDGYRSYSHMCVQLEDCLDCCNVLFPEFEHKFLFSSSSGHCNKRNDGLDTNAVNKGFGGAQPRMESVIIEFEDGILGQYERTLQVGGTQHMIFQDGDSGQCLSMMLNQRTRIRRSSMKILLLLMSNVCPSI
jgi:hypothetical protein